MSFRRLLKEKKYLVHLLVTIACLICIPLIIVQLLMMEMSTRGFFRMNEENIQEKMQERTTAFAQQIEDMSITAIRVGQDDLIRKASKKTSSDYSVYDAAQKLKEYNTDDYSVGIWFYDSGSVLINEVRIQPDRLYEMLSGGAPAAYAPLVSFFEQGEQMRIMSTVEYTAGKGGIIMAMPISFRFSLLEKDALVFFVMNQNVVVEEFFDKFYDCSGVALLDSDGNFLARSEDFPRDVYESDEFQAFLSNGDERNYSFTYEGDRFNIYKYTDSNGYTSMVSMSEENQELHLLQYVTNIRFTLITSIILMLVLLTLTVMITYRPIKLLTQKHGSKTAETGLSELELLDSAFFAVDQKILSMNQLLKNNIVSDLLSGRPADIKHLYENTVDHDVCGCVVFALNGPAVTSTQSAEIIAAMKNNCDCDIYITGITYRPQILMVFVLHQETSTEYLAVLLRGFLKEITGSEYTISIGKTVDRITDIRKSYLSILTASGEHDNAEAGINDRVAESIQRFGESIHSADPVKIQKHLDIVESALEEARESDELKKYYCYKLLMVYFANTRDTYCPREEMNRLLGFTDARQLFVMMKQSVRTVCVMMKESEDASANKLGKKLLEYVDENYTEPDLCLTSAADYLGTSIYVVSRLFKEVTGKGFKEFVTDKRLENARTLLETTSHNVSEIAVMTGFENAVYFSNLFKSKYGLAPTQYRKVHRT